MPPSPVEANTGLPGGALAGAISSASVFAGTPSPTPQASGNARGAVSKAQAEPLCPSVR